MRSKEIITAADQEEALKAFLAKLRVAGSITVEIGDDQFIVDIRAKTSPEGRRMLAKGGPDREI